MNEEIEKTLKKFFFFSINYRGFIIVSVKEVYRINKSMCLVVFLGMSN
jgi:hypothetical protein